MLDSVRMTAPLPRVWGSVGGSGREVEAVQVQDAEHVPALVAVQFKAAAGEDDLGACRHPQGHAARGAERFVETALVGVREGAEQRERARVLLDALPHQHLHTHHAVFGEAHLRGVNERAQHRELQQGADRMHCGRHAVELELLRLHGRVQSTT